MDGLGGGWDWPLRSHQGVEQRPTLWIEHRDLNHHVIEADAGALGIDQGPILSAYQLPCPGNGAEVRLQPREEWTTQPAGRATTRGQRCFDE
jgi:hypothetical protein